MGNDSFQEWRSAAQDGTLGICPSPGTVTSECFVTNSKRARRRIHLAGLWQDKGLVFPNETGSLFNPSNLRSRSFQRIKARAEVREDLRFHDLRHTCATLLLGEGVNAKEVSEMLGHASITITLNTYSHVLPDMQDSAADAMEAVLS